MHLMQQNHKLKRFLVAELLAVVIVIILIIRGMY